MKYKIFTFVLLSASVCLSSCDKTPKLGKDSVEAVVAAMTLEEKARSVTGTGILNFNGDNVVFGALDTIIPGEAGTTHAIERLGIPAIVLADGPAGVRIASTRKGSSKTYYATAFPIGTLLASSWDTEMVENVGRAMGNEALEYGIDILLAPAMNIHRNPLCGRNFEYYSEDPVVSGKIAGAMIKGIQANGVGASAKHFAANNQETNRFSSDSRLTQRALREIYLRGFEMAVKEASPWTVMTSYNLINGVHTPESSELLTDILRKEWNFGGMVMTDWFGGKSTTNMIRAGNDLLMPGFGAQKEEIMNAVNEGSLNIKHLDSCVIRILELIVKTPKFKGYMYSDNPDLVSHAATARQAAAEGMILLKNDNRTLPFTGRIKNIAIYGVASYDFISGGTGSGDVNSAYTVSPAKGLINAGYAVDEGLLKMYETYREEVQKGKPALPDTLDILAPLMPKQRPGELIPAPASLNAHANTADIAVITIGRQSGEMLDRRINGDFDLTEKEQKLIEAVTRTFHAKNKKVVVVLNIGGVIETHSWKAKPDAILLAWQGGQEGGNSVADILSGKVNPSGKLTMTFPVKYMDVPSAMNFPYDYKLTGGLIESAISRRKRTQHTRNIDYTMYEEDIYVGYRYFDSFDKPVSYPFGYGLSYTDFVYSDATVEQNEGDTYTISVRILNTGKTSGKEVVQLYVTPPDNPPYSRPKKELKAFAKTRELAPGEDQTVKMTVTKQGLAFFDSLTAAWITPSGNYTFSVCASSASVRRSVVTNISAREVYPAHNVLNPQESIDVLTR